MAPMKELLVALVRRLVNGGGVGRSRYHTIHFRYYTLFHFWLRPEARGTVSTGLELAKLHNSHSVSLRYLSRPEIKHIL